jgi:hypothetical protein
MTVQPYLIYALGTASVILGLVVGRRGHVVRARDVRGSIVAGEVNESVTITNTETDATGDADRREGHGDRIAWVIGIVGVLIAAAQFAHDAFGFLK